MISLRYTIVKGKEKWVVIKQVWTALDGVDRRFVAQFDSWNECMQFVSAIISLDQRIEYDEV